MKNHQRWKILSWILFGMESGKICHAQTLDPTQINAEINERLAEQFSGGSATNNNEAIILRMDMLADELTDRAKTGIDNDPATQISFVQNGLRVTNIWQDILFDPIQQQSDLSVFVAALLGLLPGNFQIDPYPGFLESREEALNLWQSEDRNVSTEIQVYYERVLDFYGGIDASPDISLPSPELDLSPVYQVSYGYVNSTNAKNYGALPEGSRGAGRCNMALNLGARKMLEKDYFAIAAIHETWHCFHDREDTSPNDLLKRALREGAVTYLTGLILDDISPLPADTDTSSREADLLFWSVEELQAAEAVRSELVTAFAQDFRSSEASVLRNWMILGGQLPAVPGAPSRSGYYMGLLAIQDHVEKSLVSPLAKGLLDLVDTPEGRDAILDSFLIAEGQPINGDPSSAERIVWYFGLRLGVPFVFWIPLAILALLLFMTVDL